MDLPSHHRTGPRDPLLERKNKKDKASRRSNKGFLREVAAFTESEGQVFGTPCAEPGAAVAVGIGAGVTLTRGTRGQPTWKGEQGGVRGVRG